jgi:membrane fusion protein, multidrug efflux system
MSIRSILVARPRLVLLGVGLLLVLALVLSWSRGSARSKAARHGAPEAVQVDTAAAARADVPIYLEGLGAVQAFYTVTVTARVDGQLDKIGFVEGQRVKKGAVLAQIDPRPYQAALDQAIAVRAKDTAMLTNAKSDLERYLILAPKDLASKQTVDTQRATVAQLEAQLKADDATIENARTQLSYTTITSPIDGRTGIRQVDPGNIVRAADTRGIVVMTQVQPISLIFTLPESTLATLAEALANGAVPVTALAREGGKELDRGTVMLIDNQIDQTTGTIRVKANFANAAQRLWPGEFVTARVLVRTEKNALTIPATALQRGPDGAFAYVVKADSTVEARPITVTEQGDDVVIVNRGLKDGEHVVTSNLYRLEPGARVRVNGAAVASGRGARVTGATPAGREAS